MTFRTLRQAGGLDAADDEDRASLLAALEELLQACSAPLGHENTFFHSALRARAPRAVLPFDRAHQGQAQPIAAQRGAWRQDGARRAAGGAVVRGEASVRPTSR